MTIPPAALPPDAEPWDRILGILPALSPRAIRIGRRFRLDDAEALAVMHDAICRTVERLLRGAAIENLLAWLLTCVRRQLLDQVRRPGRSRPLEAAEFEAATARCGDPGDLQAYMRDAVGAAFAQLPERDQAVLRAHDLDGWTYRTASARLGMTGGIFNRRLREARFRLYRAAVRILAEHGYGRDELPQFAH